LTLVDTSVWVDHFRAGNPILAQLLTDAEAGLHPFVLGELAAGNLKNRVSTLRYFASLPQAVLSHEQEVHSMVESCELWGTGLGWVDLHILTSAASSGWVLYSTDRAMVSAARKMRLRLPEYP
jgi:hypothetical protein